MVHIQIVGFMYCLFVLLFWSVLSDPATRLEYDLSGNYEIDKYTLRVRNKNQYPSFWDKTFFGFICAWKQII